MICFFSIPAVYSLLMFEAAFWYHPLSPAISAANNNLRQGGIVMIPHWRVFLPLHEAVNLGDSFVFSAKDASAIWTSQKEEGLIASTVPGDNHTHAYFPAVVL